MQDDSPKPDCDDLSSILDRPPASPPNPYGDTDLVRGICFRGWLSKLLIFVFYICFSPLPSSSNIGPLTGLWFDTIFLKRPNVMSQAASAGE